MARSSGRRYTRPMDTAMDTPTVDTPTVDTPSVEIARYPALRLLAWQLHQERLSEPEALALYEREWRHLDPDRLGPDERALIEHLARTYGQGVLNV
jgi:hypothetical protein